MARSSTPRPTPLRARTKTDTQHRHLHDQHWFLALAAPRPFIALEGEDDKISLPEAVKQSILGAEPAYALLGAGGRIGVNYAKHGHTVTAEDWTALMDYFDLHLRGRKVQRTFDRFPAE